MSAEQPPDPPPATPVGATDPPATPVGAADPPAAPPAQRTPATGQEIDRTAASTASLWTLLREDWASHGRSWLHPGLHALVVYRFGHWRLGKPMWLRLPVTIWYKIVNGLLIRNLYGVEIGDEAFIGRRVRLGHHQTVHIPSFCVIGDDSILRHNITIGFTKGGVPRDAVPRIGRRVSIGPGAYLLGPITVGDDAVIGPASMVTMNVPAGSTVFAAPARIMKPTA